MNNPPRIPYPQKDVFEPSIYFRIGFKDLAELSEIIPNTLYLSNYETSINFKLLRKKKITHILSLSNFHRSMKKTRMKFVYKNICIRDSIGVNIQKYFDECFDYISSALDNPGNRLVINCNAGVSRSATVTIAWIMKSRGITLKDAFSQVKDQRPYILPNTSFMRQLIDFENDFLGQSTVSITTYNQWKKKDPILLRRYTRIIKQNRDYLRTKFFSVDEKKKL